MSLPPSTAASRPSASASSRPTRLARLRVPLGFACGVIAFVLARPTQASLVAGGLVAAAGEALRVWAAGHLEKGSEVTKSGPYRWSAHPLYLGSAIIGLGVAIASAHAAVLALVAGYLLITLTAAIRTEEAALTAKFGDEYTAYQQGRAIDARRRFRVERVMRNRELRAVVGLAVGMVLLALRMIVGI
jgi:protein-S-isoprenylcysteine O-methyltransferase Ste14